MQSGHSFCILQEECFHFTHYMYVLCTYVRTLSNHNHNHMRDPLPCPESSHIFSPWIVAITFLVCLLARNSRYQMPCHVPVANLPFEMGIVTDAPIRADLMCACAVTKYQQLPFPDQVGLHRI